MHKKVLSVTALIFSILLSSCSFSDNPSPNNIKNTGSDTSFNDYCEELFLDIATEDALTLNYLISDISNFDIEEYPDEMIAFDCDEIEVDMDEVNEIRSNLKKYDYDNLSFDQQITYDSLIFYLDCCEARSGLEFYYEPLSPTIGFQAELPTTLSEYTFYTKEDIDRYLKALPTIYDLFEEIMEYEKLKSKKKLFMSDDSAQGVIDQCSEFISKTEDNYLITSFNDDIDNFEGLSEDEKTYYKEKNKEIVLSKIIPAYELMINTLNNLKATGYNTKGLCNFDKGKEYYEYLIMSNIGTDKSVNDIKTELQNKIDSGLSDMFAHSTLDSDYFTKLSEAKIESSTPEEMLEKLINISKSDFPDIGEITYSLKDVDSSLEEFISPAMYYKPPVDNKDQNTIFINHSKMDDSLETFVTLAHEGVPGHLYQFNYIKDNENYPLRQVIDFTGVSEGWAKYAEYKSYSYTGLDEKIAEGLATNSQVALCVEAVADIGVNYENWSKNDVYEYVRNYFSITEETAETIYQSSIQTPGNIVCYAYGALVFEQLEDTAKQKKGKDFNSIEFNKALLDIGLAPFPVIDEYFNRYY